MAPKTLTQKLGDNICCFKPLKLREGGNLLPSNRELIHEAIANQPGSLNFTLHLIFCVQEPIFLLSPGSLAHLALAPDLQLQPPPPPHSRDGVSAPRPGAPRAG